MSRRVVERETAMVVEREVAAFGERKVAVVGEGEVAAVVAHESRSAMAVGSWGGAAKESKRNDRRRQLIDLKRKSAGGGAVEGTYGRPKAERECQAERVRSHVCRPPTVFAAEANSRLSCDRDRAARPTTIFEADQSIPRRPSGRQLQPGVGFAARYGVVRLVR